MMVAYAHSPYPDVGFVSSLGAEPVSIMLFLVAFALGAFHSLEPGHGKSIGAAYLIGSKSVLHALLYGVVTTVTHVAVVFLMGFIVLFGTAFFTPNLNATLQLLSGLMVVIIGLWTFHRSEHHHHKRANTFALAVSAGIVPCPTAIAILLTAVNTGRLVLGIAILIAFSLGIGVVLTSIALVSIKSSGLMVKRLDKYHHIIPKVSGMAITVLGLLLTFNSLSGFVLLS